MKGLSQATCLRHTWMMLPSRHDWESDPFVWGIEHPLHIFVRLLRRKLKMNSQWELNPQVKGLYAVQTFQSRIERDSLVLNAPPRGYGLRCRTWEIEVVAGSESHAQHLCFLLRERYNAMVLCPSVMPH